MAASSRTFGALGLAVAGLVPIRAAAAISLEQVEAAVIQHVAARLDIDTSQVEVPWLGLAEPLACEATDTLYVTSRPGEQFRGHGDVRVEALSSDGTVCTRFRIKPKITAWVEVPVAAVAAGAGSQPKLVMGRVRWDRVNGAPVDIETGPLELLKAVQAGEPITNLVVRAQPAARSGAVVEIVAGRGALKVTAGGRLMGDGYLGQPVRVANLATGSVVTGVLVAPNEVRAGATP